MSNRIEVLDSETYEWVLTEREYIETNNDLTYGEEVGDYYRSTETRKIPVYLDTANGLVVHDIAAYEKWIKELR